MSEYIVKTFGSSNGGTYDERYDEIVRCRDCESYQPGMYKHFTCEYLHKWAKPDGFCAWGVRKDD